MERERREREREREREYSARETERETEETSALHSFGLRARIVSAQGKSICDRTCSKFIRELTSQLKTRAHSFEIKLAKTSLRLKSTTVLN